MMKRFRFPAGLLALSFLLAPPAGACGPFFERAIFVHEAHPDFPLEDFAAGSLGVLRPGYARSYLVPAYRHLTGIRLDAAEQNAVRKLWDHRLGIARPTEVTTAPEEKWLDARESVAGKGKRPRIQTFKSMSGTGFYFDFLNCNAFAFSTATVTLNDRIRSLGAASPVLKDWVSAQDMVFSNCGGEGAKAIPAPLPPAAPALALADRAYQVATAHFYAGSFDEAELLFRQIAKDTSSPWRSLAPYLAARAAIRKATVSSGEVDSTLVSRAQKDLEAILADPAQKTMHEPARRLLSFAALRSDPAAAVLVTSKEVLRKGAGDGLLAALDDYTFALDKLSPPVPENVRQDDLTDWILTLQDSSDAARTRSVQKYLQTKSLPWLLAALSKAHPADSATAGLIDAGRKVPPSSPGFVMAAFHVSRLEADSGKAKDARERLDTVLASKMKIPASSRNELMALRLKISPSFSDALRFAARIPAAYSYNEDGRELPSEDTTDQPKRREEALLDEDAASLFNRQLPLERWLEAVRSKELSEGLRGRLAMAGWLRSALLDDEKMAREFGKEATALSKEMAPAIQEYAEAKTKEQRLFIAALTTLRLPGLRPSIDANLPRTEAPGEIDSFRDNWWCGGGTKSVPEEESSEVAIWPFLNAAEIQKGRTELVALTALGTAPNFLTRTATDHVNASPQDERGAEALHLAVRSTRYGCTDSSTSGLSKAAFQLLKKRFLKSSWAQQTKYWY